MKYETRKQWIKVQYQQELERIKKANLKQADLEIIARFHQHLFAKPVGHQRVTKLSIQLRQLIKLMQTLNINKNLVELNKNDLINIISHVNLHPTYKDYTKNDYTRLVKQFFLWFEDDDPRWKTNPEEAKTTYKFIKKGLKKNNKLIKPADPNTIITQKDLDKVIKYGCNNTFDKAYISLLHETGARIGEFQQLQVGHIKPGMHKTSVFIPQGKTVPREVYSFKSWPYLKAYLDTHPHKDDPTSPLWLSVAHCNRGEIISDTGIRQMIRRCFQRAGVTKKHHPHWFRHSRATLWATKFPTQILIKLMGWEDERQAKIYVHLSQDSIRDAFDKANGLPTQEAEQEQTIKCLCGLTNPNNIDFCSNCYRPLTLEKAMDVDKLKNEEISKTMKYLLELAKDPVEWAKFQEFKAEQK